MNTRLKTTLTHVLAIVIMLAASCIYFAPALQGDIIVQGDMQKGDAMAHQQRVVADSTGTIPNWNPSMFSGMPGYQTAADPQRSVFTPLKSILIMRPLGLERNVGMLWIYLIGFYVAMLALGCGPWLALLGSLAFGLGSYNIIIVEAGHIAKGWAMSMMAPMLAGMVLSFKAVLRDEKEQRYIINWRRLVWGAILFTLATGLQITFNHIQITFYTVIAGVVMGLTYAVYALKDRWVRQFLVVVGVLLIGCAFAIGSNYRHLTVNQEYAKVTMRGGSEISVKPHDLGLEDARQTEATQSGGLDINYAFSWSYGVGETYTLLVPYAMGGASGEQMADDSEWTRTTRMQQAPTYWGDQPFTSGPVYFGAIVVLLFVLGCIVVKGPERWWLIIATVIGVVMAWGRHFMPLNEFLFNHLPLYNKFRTPSMSLVLSNVTMVMMGVLALKSIMEQLRERQTATAKGTKANVVDDYDRQKRLSRALAWSVGIVGGILLVGMLVGATRLTFSGPDNDSGIEQQYLSSLKSQGVSPEQIAQWDQTVWPQMRSALQQERKSMFMRDSWRSLAFVLLASALLWLYASGKLKREGWLVALLTVLIVIDLWSVDRRYLNKENFVAPERLALHPNDSERLLDRTAQMNGDRDYRVYDLTVNTFNDSRPSAFHNEIGGYSAAKLRRYQDLIDFYLSNIKFYDYVNNMQMGVIGNDGAVRLGSDVPYAVLDMLNCRYVMMPMQQGIMPVRRSTALGPCWLAEEVHLVDDANAEILALNDFDPYRTAIVDRSQWASQLEGLEAAPRDSSESITLIHTYPQTPDHLTYESHTRTARLAVFSEIYYAADWRAYIDGKPADYLRADYVLRALVLPAGDHRIEFVNEAPTLHRHDRITLIISLLMLAVMGGALWLVYRKKEHSSNQ